ncbi:MAG: response regulator [Promethearchaeota archaeon]
MSVFVVEDEPSLQFFYKQVLNLNNFKLAGIAKDGEEAVSLFKSFLEKPKVILMDYRLPKKNGITVTREILQIDNSVKIIFTSADDSAKEEALSLGACVFLDKPFTISQLIEEIKKAMKDNKN